MHLSPNRDVSPPNLNYAARIPSLGEKETMSIPSSCVPMTHQLMILLKFTLGAIEFSGLLKSNEWESQARARVTLQQPCRKVWPSMDGNISMAVYIEPLPPVPSPPMSPSPSLRPPRPCVIQAELHTTSWEGWLNSQVSNVHDSPCSSF